MIDHSSIIPGTFVAEVCRTSSSQAGLASYVGVPRA